MRARRFERMAVAKFFVAGWAAFCGACAAIEHARAQAPLPWILTVPPPPPPVFNPSSPYTVPQPSYTPISPKTPSTLLGSEATSPGSLAGRSYRRVVTSPTVASNVAKAPPVRTLHHHRGGSIAVGPAAKSYYYSPFGDGYGCVWRQGWDGYWFRTAPCF